MLISCKLYFTFPLGSGSFSFKLWELKSNFWWRINVRLRSTQWNTYFLDSKIGFTLHKKTKEKTNKQKNTSLICLTSQLLCQGDRSQTYKYLHLFWGREMFSALRSNLLNVLLWEGKKIPWILFFCSVTLRH